MLPTLQFILTMQTYSEIQFGRSEHTHGWICLIYDHIFNTSNLDDQVELHVEGRTTTPLTIQSWHSGK